jgi:phage terminase small subunit
MARPRKPTNVLQLAGAFKKNPDRGRARANEPRPTGAIGDPPDALSEAVRKAWHDTVAEAPPGVLTNADRGILTLVAMLRDHAEHGEIYITREGVVTDERVWDTKKLALLKSCYTELGMTPASRSKVQIKPAEEAATVTSFAAV